MHFYTVSSDKVISGYVVTATATYGEALDMFYPLIGRLEMQRDPLQTRFYSRLEADIIRGCVMPPVTLALIHRMDMDTASSIAGASNYICTHIKNGFVLDGIQRLTTLERASRKTGFDPERPIHVSFVLTDSRDRLLYRMITLNNGQRPMSARHQIEVLADSFFDLTNLDMKLIPEKGAGRVRTSDSFRKGDFIKGYVAYLSNSVNIDNQKIIEEKMDELIASRIIDSDIPTTNIEFSDVVDLINRLSESQSIGNWLRSQNNFIGFCVGIKSSLGTVQSATLEDVQNAINTFEAAFSSVNVSKVNLGKLRRELVSKFISHYDEMQGLQEYALLDRITDWI